VSPTVAEIAMIQFRHGGTRFLTIAALLLATPAAAQWSVEVGMQNTGQLTTERTHHVRLGNMGSDLYLGAALAVPVRDGVAVRVLGVRVLPTYLFVWSCASDPCEPISRWSHRPHDGISKTAWLTHLSAGVEAAHSTGPLALSAGVGPELTVMHALDYHGFGAGPMGALGAWGEASAGWRGVVGLVLGVSYLPPYGPRWTVLQEWSGAKSSGEPTPAGWGNSSVWAVRLGARVGR
jgi:hypothetical protein